MWIWGCTNAPPLGDWDCPGAASWCCTWGFTARGAGAGSLVGSPLATVTAHVKRGSERARQGDNGSDKPKLKLRENTEARQWRWLHTEGDESAKDNKLHCFFLS